MTLKQKAKQDNSVMHVLRVAELSHVIGYTNKGTLTLKLVKDGTEKDYKFLLDAVPYPEETNKKLLEIFEGVLWEKDKEIITAFSEKDE